MVKGKRLTKNTTCYIIQNTLILKFYAYNAVNDLIKLSFIFTGDFYSTFFENLVNMPKTTSRNNYLHILNEPFKFIVWKQNFIMK